MSYPKLTTPDSVKSYLTIAIPSFSATTLPSLNTVNDWIDRVTAIIYGAISDQYIVPITNDTDLLQLKDLADIYVVAKVKDVLGHEDKDGRRQGAHPLTSFWDQLGKYESGELALPNSPSNSGSVQCYSPNQENNIQAVSSKSGGLW